MSENVTKRCPRCGEADMKYTGMKFETLLIHRCRNRKCRFKANYSERFPRKADSDGGR